MAKGQKGLLFFLLLVSEQKKESSTPTYRFAALWKFLQTTDNHRILTNAYEVQNFHKFMFDFLNP